MGDILDCSLITSEVSGIPVSVFPNPVSDQLQYRVTEGTSLSIFNAQGNRMMTLASLNEGSLSMSGLHAGIYTLVFSNNLGARAIWRVVKQ